MKSFLKTTLSVLAAFVVASLINNLLVSKNIQKRPMGDQMYAQTVEGAPSLSKTTVSLRRGIPGVPLYFHAHLAVDGENVSLIKGYVEGNLGANFSIGGTPAGFGISSPEFWMESDNTQKDTLAFKVYVNFKRTSFLFFQEGVTYLVGTYRVNLAPPAKPKSGAAATP